MYYDDHSPPHFHALYQGREAEVAIDTCEFIDGELTPRAGRLVLTWAKVRQSELQENWNRAQRHASLAKLSPLE